MAIYVIHIILTPYFLYSTNILAQGSPSSSSMPSPSNSGRLDSFLSDKDKIISFSSLTMEVRIGEGAFGEVIISLSTPIDGITSIDIFIYIYMYMVILGMEG